jgi:cephalosporin hydroxylase
MTDKDIVQAFSKLYYDSKAWRSTRWMGRKIQKLPSDLWMYQEIIFKNKPTLIVETGTGGSTIFMENMFDLMGSQGRIISIDVADREVEDTFRIKCLRGSSIDGKMFDQVKSMVVSTDKVMVVLDSNHFFDHVIEEMRMYAELVSVGQYMIVEDTNLNGNPVCSEHGPGPMEAVKEFMSSNDQFVVDSGQEKFMLTFNPGGFLLRTK